ncbi:hypothetical protein C8Q74DRAFT_861839 [Fomes fomentarius]|nr:hypothetical protein C8Q74DRAFT_861839 [Fomes fomentarius]
MCFGLVTAVSACLFVNSVFVFGFVLCLCLRYVGLIYCCVALGCAQHPSHPQHEILLKFSSRSSGTHRCDVPKEKADTFRLVVSRLNDRSEATHLFGMAGHGVEDDSGSSGLILQRLTYVSSRTDIHLFLFSSSAPLSCAPPRPLEIR